MVFKARAQREFENHASFPKERIAPSILLASLLLVPNICALCAEKVLLPVMSVCSFEHEILRLESVYIVF